MADLAQLWGKFPTMPGEATTEYGQQSRKEAGRVPFGQTWRGLIGGGDRGVESREQPQLLRALGGGSRDPLLFPKREPR